MAQASHEDNPDDTVIMNTQIEERAWLNSPQTTEFSKDDLNTIKQMIAHARRDNDDEALKFISNNAHSIYLLARKTEMIPYKEAAAIEEILNSRNNITAGLLYAILGTPGANLIDMNKITESGRFTRGPVARLTALAVLFTTMGHNMENHTPDLMEQVTRSLSDLANQLLTDPENVIGLCITNHIHKILTQCSECELNSTLVGLRNRRFKTEHPCTSLAAEINRQLQLNIIWSGLISPNNCAKTWCGDPLPNKDTEMRYHNMNNWTIRMIGEFILTKAKDLTRSQDITARQGDTPANRSNSSNSPTGSQVGKTEDRETYTPQPFGSSLKKRRQRQRAKYNSRHTKKESTDEQNNFAQVFL